MKSRLCMIAACCLFPLFLQATTKTNKTTFIPRPQSSDITLSMLRWHSHTNDEKKNFGGRLSLAPFYSHSVNGSDLGKYFMFDGKNTLKIAAADADVHPYNFNLRSTYNGTISFSPKQEVFGVPVNYFQHIKLLDGLYWSVRASVVHVANDPGLKETISANGTADYNGPFTFKNALAGHMLTSDWSEPFKYGKINGKQEKTGISDIDVKLGYTVLNDAGSKIALNVGVTLPTSNKPEAVYVFEPLLGNGKHWALGAGLDTTFSLWRSDNVDYRYLYVVVAGDYRYLFENTQMRTLELKGKNWGRFIRMRQENPSSAGNLLGNSLPGINALTRSVKVTPGSQFDAEVALCLRVNRNWHVGLGYNIWARGEESVKLKNSWDAAGKFGLISSNNLYAQAGTVTAPAAAQPNPAYLTTGPIGTGISSNTTIKATAAGNGNFIQASDIDTAPHPFALTHKIFGNVDYTFTGDIKLVVGAWGSYEFASENTALEQWAVGLKAGTSF